MVIWFAGSSLGGQLAEALAEEREVVKTSARKVLRLDCSLPPMPNFRLPMVMFGREEVVV